MTGRRTSGSLTQARGFRMTGAQGFQSNCLTVLVPVLSMLALLQPMLLASNASIACACAPCLQYP
eukprot:1160434-Pelagomonas_calceolata.AAC.5